MTNITASRGDLARALSIGASIVAPSPIPAANNVLMTVQKGRADLLFSDLDIWLGRSIPAKSDTITATTIPASLFARAAQSMEGDTLCIRLEKGSAHLSAGRAKMRMLTLAAEHFPRPAQDEDPDEMATCKAGPLGIALERVAYAAPADGSVYINAVHFNASVGGELDLATYDGKRLAFDCAINEGCTQEPFNLPVKAARTLAKLCSEAPTVDVQFFASDRLATFRCAGWELTSKLIDADFAPYRKIVDALAEDPVTIDRQRFERALGRLALIADRHANGVHLSLSRDTLTLALANDKNGAGVEELEVDYDGPDRSAGYNLGFLRDAASHAAGDEIMLCINAQDQATIRSVEDVVDSSIHSIGNYIVKEVNYDA
jgi:DNA polymerase-3 subunit beta